MDITELSTDIESAEKGKWFPFSADCEVKIAQWMNKKHAAFLRDVTKRHGRRIATGAIPEEEAQKILAEQWKFIITDFKGMTENGEDVEYSPEIIEKWALDKRLKKFFKICEEVSKEDSNYFEENIEELGNLSQPTSNGSTDGESEKKTSKK